MSDNETERRWARRAPGDGWYELARDVAPGETVEIVEGRAEIIQPTKDEVQEAGRARREALVAAFPDILLAVADGADLAEEVRKALAKAKVADGER